MKKVMPTQKSWSVICRKRVNYYINQINKSDYMACIQWAVENLSHSYRPTIFKIRCAKMLRRAIKNRKIKENPIAVQNYHNYVNEIKEIYGFDARWPN